MTLTVEQVTGVGATSPTVRVSLRNQTQRTVAFVGAPPEEFFSVTVLGPSGAPAAVAKGKELMFKPSSMSRAPLVGREPWFLPLPPQQDVLFWKWNVADDFDMSVPGTYRVSLGGRLRYLDTTVCSNTEVKVGN